MIYVVSRNYDQARILSKLIGLHSSEFKFVSDSHQLIGLDRPTVILWGDYQNRCDWPEVEDQIQSRRSTILDLQAIEDGHRRVLEFWLETIKARERAAVACHFPGYIQTVNHGAF